VKTIDSGKEITNLAGQTINMSDDDPTPFNIGKAISNILISGKVKKFDSFKSYSLAKMFYDQDKVELDDADFSSLKDIFESDEVKELYKPLILGQIMQAMMNCS